MQPTFNTCWLWIKLSWHSCSMWGKPGWLNWFWQFLCERLSSFNPKRFYYSYAWSCSLCEERTSFCTGLNTRKLCRFLLMFLIGFTSFSLTSFSSINHLLPLFERLLVLFHLTSIKFSWSTPLLMCLSLATLTSIRTGLQLLSLTIGFTPCKAEQLLWGMELQQKEAPKDYSIQEICLDRTYS